MPQVSVQFDKPALVPGRARRTLRNTMNNAVRPPMRKAVSNLQHTGRYEALSPYWQFSQETTQDGGNYSLFNTHPASRYLHAPNGTQAHDIEMPAHNAPMENLLEWAARLGRSPGAAYAAHEKIAREGQIMHHPGTAPDEPVLSILAQTEEAVLERIVTYHGRWAQEWGQGEIGG